MKARVKWELMHWTRTRHHGAAAMHWTELTEQVHCTHWALPDCVVRV